MVEQSARTRVGLHRVGEDLVAVGEPQVGSQDHRSRVGAAAHRLKDPVEGGLVPVQVDRLVDHGR